MNKQFKVEHNRETIGGVEVVDAEFADQLLTACANVLRWKRKVSTVKHGLGRVREQLGTESVKYKQVEAELWYSVKQLQGATRSMARISKTAAGSQAIHGPIDLSFLHTTDSSPSASV